MEKDKAEKYASKGINEYNEGKYESAIYWFKNAQNLYETERVTELLKNAEKKIKEKNISQNPEARCNEILNKENYYEILGIEKTASQDDIKKSYKKLAMEFHPDKNNTLKASEAFKHVNKAYKCLIDDNKRAYYDSTGKEEEVIINMEHIFTKETFIIAFLSVLHGTIFSPGHNLYSFFTPSAQISSNYSKILKFVPSILLIFLILSSLYMQFTQDNFSSSNNHLLKTPEDNVFPDIHEAFLYQDLEKNLWENCENSESLKNYILLGANRTSGIVSKMFVDYAETINFSSCFYLDQLILHNLNRDLN